MSARLVLKLAMLAQAPLLRDRPVLAGAGRDYGRVHFGLCWFRIGWPRSARFEYCLSTGSAPVDDPDRGDDPIALDKPSAARIYDYYLGGFHNFAADREAAARALAVRPDGALIAQANRAFLHRSVRYLVDNGIRQFIDLGSGIPTAGNVHEVASEAKVVYVDIDPVAVAYSQTILAGDDRAAIVQADLRRPDKVLKSPITRGLLDFDQPIGLLMVAVLHFVADAANPAGLVAAYRDAVPTGSALAIAHGTPDERPEEAAQVTAVYKDTASPATFRTKAQIEAVLAGWDIVEPGLTWLVEWHPDWPDDLDDDPSWCANYGAVGWKR
jgi:O-methyltransferase involved in polyketide biosynthesis